MNRLTRAFLLGLSLLLPVVLSVQLVLWLVSTVEDWLKSLWLMIVPETLYFPGLALLSFIALCTLIGLLSRTPVIRGLLRLPGRALERIPLVRYIYSTIRDFLDLIGGKTFAEESVVWVSLPQINGRVLGMITKHGNDSGGRLTQLIREDEVAVYLPMSYQAGGYMVVVNREQIEHTSLSPGEALHVIMSAGLGEQRR